MPKGIPKNGVNKGWFKKGYGFWTGKKRPDMLGNSWNVGKTPWNKGITGYSLPKRNNPEEEEAYHWLGDKVGYQGIHRWLRINFGNANKCEAFLVGLKCNGKSKVFHWAKLKGKKHERKREHFIQLCVSCHSNYDFTEEKREKLRQSHFGPRGKYRKK